MFLMVTKVRGIDNSDGPLGKKPWRYNILGPPRPMVEIGVVKIPGANYYAGRDRPSEV